MSDILNQFCKWIHDNDSYFISADKWMGTFLGHFGNPLPWITLVFIALFFASVFFFIKNGKYKKFFEWISNHIRACSIVILVSGFILYTVGFYSSGYSALAIIPRAIISSFRMFVVANELARVHKDLQGDAIYMAFFALIHFSAAIITFMFIFKMVGYKFQSMLKIRRNYISNAKNGTVHLFWGVNESSCSLAENIKNEHFSESDTIIFIDVDMECGNNCQKKSTISSITNTITLNDSEIAFLDKIDALVDHCYNGPSSVDTSSNDDIFGQLGLNRVRKILQKNKNIYIYLLSDDEDLNISDALNLQNDKFLKELKNNDSLRLFVHARHDSYNEVYTHYSQYADDCKKTNIKIIDSAFFSIQALKLNDETLPVSCVSIDPKTHTVENPFTAMIVGFGEIGQEAFKFLYEFSVFIDSNKNKTPFRCYAFDEKMDKIEGLLRTKMPAISDEELCLVKTSVDSNLYWDYVKNNINELNYVVIALNNDASGMATAVNLFKYALKERDSQSPKLKIMVRCYDISNEKRMSEVEKKLNSSAKGMNVEIRLFATSKELFTYKNVVSDSILDEAKEFHYIYENSLLPAEKRWKLSVDEQWKQSFIAVVGEDGKEKSVIENEMEKRKISRYHAIDEINRKISQNFANSLHSRTKMIMMRLEKTNKSDKTDNFDRLKLYYGYVKNRTPKTTTYNCNNRDAELLYNMAIVEHERWIAAHKLMGYTHGCKTEYVKKHHKYMCKFQELQEEETKSYDCNVVDTTIKLAYKKVNKDSLEE